MAEALPRKSFELRLGETLTRRRKVLAGAATALGAGALGMLSAQVAVPGSSTIFVATAVAVGGALGAAVFLVIRLLLENHRLLQASSREVEALVNVRPLAGRLPVDLGGWAADAVLLDVVLRLIVRNGCRSIVECGSGWSTVLISRCLEELGEGHVVALEHDLEFARQTEALLARFGVAGRASVVHAPIEPRGIEGETWLWYGPVGASALSGPIDLLLVDGPPASVGARSRYPAAPLLEPWLRDHSIVVLDDGYRPDEAWIAGQWARRLGRVPRLVRASRGIWVFPPGPRPSLDRVQLPGTWKQRRR